MVNVLQWRHKGAQNVKGDGISFNLLERFAMSTNWNNTFRKMKWFYTIFVRSDSWEINEKWRIGRQLAG